MPEVIQVRVSKDGDIYCKDDPHTMEHHKEKKIQWHSNQIEFEIEFLNGSPFVTGETVLPSKNKWTDEFEVKHPDENGMDAYVYEVRGPKSADQQLKADPGLIIKP